MMLAIGRLVRVEEVVGGEMKVELIQNNSFKKFRQER